MTIAMAMAMASKTSLALLLPIFLVAVLAERLKVRA